MENISSTGWVLAHGMRFGSYHDAPAAFPDSMRILDATVTGRTRSGNMLGPAHRVDVITAVKAMTSGPGWQRFEEDRKGSIETGKIADFVILSDDPTEVDLEMLDQLRIFQTLKDGETVFEREAASASPDSIANPAVARLLAAPGGHDAATRSSRPGHEGHSAAGPICVSDGILRLSTAMLACAGAAPGE